MVWQLATRVRLHNCVFLVVGRSTISTRYPDALCIYTLLKELFAMASHRKHKALRRIVVAAALCAGTFGVASSGTVDHRDAGPRWGFMRVAPTTQVAASTSGYRSNGPRWT